MRGNLKPCTVCYAILSLPLFHSRHSPHLRVEVLLGGLLIWLADRLPCGPASFDIVVGVMLNPRHWLCSENLLPLFISPPPFFF